MGHPTPDIHFGTTLSMAFSLQKKFFLAFFSIGVVLVLLTAGVMHFRVREGFDDYVTNAKLKRLGRLEAVLVQMHTQPNGLDVLSQAGAWNELLNSIEAVRKEQYLQSRTTNTTPAPRPAEVVAREDKAIASSVSIMLNNRNPTPKEETEPMPPYARGVALLDARGTFIAGETVDAQHAKFEPIRNPQHEVIAYWLISRDGMAYDALARTFVEEQVKGSLLMLALAGVFSGFIAWGFSLHFRRPIAELQTGFRAVAAGRLNTRLDEAQGHEIGDIAVHFNRMTAQLEAQESARRQWVADTSHELRTPLTVLRMRTEAMRDGIVPNTEDEWQRSIKCIQDLTVLVEDLQLMAKATAGQWDLHLEEIEMNQWLTEIIDSHRPAFEQANLKLALQPLAEPMRIKMDEQRMQQVLRNILVNCMRYTDAPGQIVVSAQVLDKPKASNSATSTANVPTQSTNPSGVCLGRRLQISVKDSAPAVPVSAQPHLFERFYRVDGSRNRATGGSGLGLAISKGIIDAHGGTISATDSDLGGLNIVIELPIECADAHTKKSRMNLNLPKLPSFHTEDKPVVPRTESAPTNPSTSMNAPASSAHQE